MSRERYEILLKCLWHLGCLVSHWLSQHWYYSYRIMITTCFNLIFLFSFAIISKIFCGKTAVYYTDAESTRTSNWLRYVNVARHEAEQNLKSYQQNGRRYYWTYKPIKPGTELLEFNGTEYADMLGNDNLMEKYYSISIILCIGAFIFRVVYRTLRCVWLVQLKTI